MRPIKFRVWCNNRKKMFYESGYMQISSEKDFCVYFDDSQEWESNIDVSSDLILMQFTGLHDSEGRESCHKDICLYADDSGTTQTGIIEWSDTRAAFYIEAIGGDDEGNQDGDLDRPFKVVGTIHDPELLEKK